jgi:PKD repeat protein
MKGRSEVVSVIMLTLLIGMVFSSIIMVEGEPETHDLEVSLTAPIIRYNNTKNHLKNGSSTVLNVTVTNRGDFIEHYVNLQLLINSSIALNSTAFKLLVNGTFWATYFWAPEDGVYNLTAYAPPVLGENPPYDANNIVTTWVKVSIDEAPHCDFTYSPYSPPPNPHPVKNEPITFNASYPISYDPDWGTILNYTWNFGDGNTTTIGDDEPVTPIITHKYTDDEFTHNVTLILADTEDLISNKTKSIKIYFPPIASFSSSGHYYVGYPVIFTASASRDPDNDTGPTRGIANYIWDFGDGSPLFATDEEIATHPYTANRTYSVNLTVTDYDHLNDSRVRNITIGLGVPTANFAINDPRPLPGPYYVDETLIFDASSSEPNGEPIVNYTWTFGDGKNGTGVVCPHAFTEAEVYNVTLTVTDEKNLTDSISRNVTVVLRVHVRVEEYGNTTIIHNPSETFTANITVANVENLYSFYFRLNFPTPWLPPTWLDLFDPDSVTVTNGGFLGPIQDPDTGEVRIKWEPYPRPHEGYLIVNATLLVDTPSSGNGTLAMIAFGVATSGNCTLELSEAILSNSFQSITPIARIVENGAFHTSWPVADFTHSPPYPVVNTTVTFDASASYDPDGGSITYYEWDFDDGNKTGTSNSNIIHCYNTTGTFNVNLTVTDDEFDKWWIIYPVPVIPGRGVAVIGIELCALAFNKTLGMFETAGKLPINITVKNNGSATENFTVTAYYKNITGSYPFNTLNVSDLAPNTIETLHFLWDIHYVSKGNYTIAANASRVPDEIYFDDNYMENASARIKVWLQGDVNRDGEVNLFDAVSLLKAYGSRYLQPEYDKNPNNDLNCDGKINLFDAVILLANYGRKDP